MNNKAIVTYYDQEGDNFTQKEASAWSAHKDPEMPGICIAVREPTSRTRGMSISLPFKDAAEIMRKAGYACYVRKPK